MLRRREGSSDLGLQGAIFGTVILLCALFAAPAEAVLLPTNFFDRIPDVEAGQAGVEADQLNYNSTTDVITASGSVALNYAGYYATADRMVLNQTTQELTLVGNVVIVDPDGIEYTSDQVDVTESFKHAILQSMVMVTTDGTMITSSSTDKQAGGITILENGTYSPCGTCIDEHGHRIGWRVRTSRMVHNSPDGVIDLEQPVLEIFGLPVAWLPWMRLPDPSDPRRSGFKLPSYQYGSTIGAKVTLPYYQNLNRDMGFLLSTSLVQNQGVLLGGTFTHNVADVGSYSVTGNWIHQFNKSAFAGQVGNLDERWALQTSGRFTPTDEWTVGWSYMTFSDRDFLPTYLITHNTTNEVYATYLTSDTYADARIQEFVQLGNVTQTAQDSQGVNLPRVRVEHVEDLGENGELRFRSKFLGVSRTADASGLANGITYVNGYQGTKLHGMAEASWSKQWITGGGVTVQPTAGLRLDAANYDGASPLNPTASNLLTATPFAALDVRYPWQSAGDGVTQIIEPVAQVVYHGSNTSKVGITNDDAQSFTYDDTNIFTFNRFSGSDRQETGLRANIGAHYLLSFDNGSYLDFAAGQSFHLAGTNGVAQADQTVIEKRSLFAGGTSAFVAGVNGQLAPWMRFGAKVALDPNTGRLARGSVITNFTHQGWKLGLDYAYTAANPAINALTDQQDVGASLSVPVWEYWTADGNVSYDITKASLIDYGVGLTYDDGYVLAGASVASSGPLSFNPSAWSYKISFKLKTADGSGFGL